MAIVITGASSGIGFSLAEKLARQHDDIRALYEEDTQRSEAAIRKRAKSAVKPEVVAGVVIHALTAAKPKPRYLVGPSAKIQWWMKTLMTTSFFDKLKYRIVYGSR